MPYNRARQDNWWKRRTKLEKQLLCIALGMFFLAVLLLVSLVFYRQYGIPKGICLSKGCVQVSSQILSKLDERVDPCEDFYDFACGGFIRENVIPDGQLSYSSSSQLAELLMKQLRSILEEPVRVSDIHPTKVIKTYYSACMDEEYIDQDGLIEAQTLLNTLGGWPVLEEAWDPSSFNWIEQLKYFKEKGLNFDYLLSISAGKDLKDSTKRIINVGQPESLGLHPKLLEEGIHDPLVKSYLELMVDFAVMFGANDFKASEKLEEVLNFEIKLARNMKDKSENYTSPQFYKKMTLLELKQHYALIDWSKLLENILPEDTKLYNEKEILVEVPTYVQALGKILKNTSSETLANYLFWRAVLEISDFLPQRFDERMLKFKKLTEGVSQDVPRWKKCLDLTRNHAPLMLGAAYVRKFFNNDVKFHASNIVYELISEIKNTIENEADWMDEITKKHALEKAGSLGVEVAYADELNNDNILNSVFAEIYVSDKLFLQSYLNINKQKWNRNLNRLLEPVEHVDWRESAVPVLTNAFYNRLENLLIVPAAILQGNLFNVDTPYYLNFGGVGTLVGRELIHAFDEYGSQFDKNGNLKMWWSNRSRNAFSGKSQCFKDQYNNFYVEEVKMIVDGERTLSENIADNEGTKQAYLAYNAWVNRKGEENKLPGLKYTPRQLFWIIAAQNQCIIQRENDLKRTVSADRHAPDKYRIIGSYRNIESFARDFYCPLNSKMNPQKKCHVW